MATNEIIENILKGCLAPDDPRALPLKSYLKFRGLDPGIINWKAIRFHPALSYFDDETKKRVGDFPTLIGLITDLQGKLTGLHRSYLTGDGKKANVPAPKKIIGQVNGGGVYFSQPQDIVCVAEGIETALAIYQATHIPTVAAVSATGMASIELASTIKTVHICADKDASQAGEAAALKLASRLHFQKRKVFLHLPSMPIPEGGKSIDWLDILNSHGEGTIKKEIEGAEPWTPRAPTPIPGKNFCLKTLRSIFDSPDEETRWVVEGLLPSSGLSGEIGKPKAGKTTLVRNLVLCVARGEPFLDRATTKGSVIYLALEEKLSEVKRHFRDMGATGDEPIHVHAASAPQNAIAELKQIIDSFKPVLVIIDPLFLLVRVKDGNDYAEVYGALEPIKNLARESGTHILCVHHSRKGGSDGGDQILGSTAILASFDTALILNRGERYRTLSSIQRYGVDLEETVLNFDKETRTFSLGDAKMDAEATRVGDNILTFLALQKEPVREDVINDEAEGRTTFKRKALRELVQTGKILRFGKGGKKEPFTYGHKDFCSDVPSNRWEQGNIHHGNGKSPQNNLANSCSQPGLFEEGEI
jgi:hypothetical protein